MHRSLFIALSTLAFPIRGTAQLLCYESFTGYPAGSQIETGTNGTPGSGADGGIGWAAAWDVNNAIKSLVRAENRTASPVDYTAGSITLRGGDRALRLYDNANGSYVLSRLLSGPVATADSHGVWLSFLFRTNNAGPMTNQDFFQVGLDDAVGATAGNPRLSVGVNTLTTTFTTPQSFQFFARCGTVPAGSAFSGIEVAAAVTTLIVVHFSGTALEFDRGSLYVNPVSLHEPGLPLAVASSVTGVRECSHLIIRSSGLEAGDAYVVDEIRIGRDYRSVVDRMAPELSPRLLHDVSGNLLLRWPVQPAALMETSTTLTPDAWEPLAGSPTTVSGHWQQLLPAGTQRRFFRLSK